MSIRMHTHTHTHDLISLPHTCRSYANARLKCKHPGHTYARSIERKRESWKKYTTQNQHIRPRWSSWNEEEPRRSHEKGCRFVVLYSYFFTSGLVWTVWRLGYQHLFSLSLSLSLFLGTCEVNSGSGGGLGTRQAIIIIITNTAKRSHYPTFTFFSLI